MLGTNRTIHLVLIQLMAFISVDSVQLMATVDNANTSSLDFLSSHYV
jgi:hypothetical protein